MTGSAVATYRVGDAVITRVPDLTLEGVPAERLFPEGDPAETEVEARRLDPASVDPATGLLRLGVHAWLVRTPMRTVLVDAAAGSGKTRSVSPVWHQLDAPFLERLLALGVRPEQVDAVLYTHLHVDHVGWATRRAGDRWVPTFPRARHFFSGRERAYIDALAAGDEGGAGAIREKAGLGSAAVLPDFEFYADSIEPVIEAGQAREVAADGTEPEPGFRFLPSPGHSIDHASIGFTSRGEHALFWGDVMHSPLQLRRPDWNSAYCEFPDAAREARRWAMGHAADTGALVLTTHFAGSAAGRVSRAGDGFSWRFA